MTETELKTELKKKTLSGIYFFYGDEDYMKNHYGEEIRKAILTDESPAAFNHFIFNDETAEFDAVTDAVLAPAMMSDRKLVELSLTNGDLFRDKNRFTGLLETAADSPDTVLLIRMSSESFDAGSAKKPSAILKLISKYAKCVNFEYQTEGRLVKWLERHAMQYGVALEQNEALTIIRRAGRGMYRLQGEIQKAAVYAAAHGLPRITEEVIGAVVTKTDDDDAFRLANCILAGDKKGALLCLDEKIRRREEPILVLSRITKAFCDLAAAARFMADGRDRADFAKSMNFHSYKAELYFKAVRGIPTSVFDDAVAACTEADRLLKSTNLGYIAIERLICRR
ncbi:MAG: DNA polymerase III subunit delta [Ruminococcaceae bacterium]|nr:DNA polymerase III subunit delta [Oscillospiraceae bacterium]